LQVRAQQVLTEQQVPRATRVLLAQEQQVRLVQQEQLAQEDLKVLWEQLAHLE
jgi:hypothetical protein